jgi:hypothetical protein
VKKAQVFIRAGVLPVALAGLIVAHADPPARAVADLCSVMIRNPHLRSERETYFLGSARSDTVQVRISDVPGVLRPQRYPYRDSTPVFGQVVRVRSVYGADADRVRASFKAGDSTVVVIHYSFNPACQTFPTRAWFDTGVVNHYTVFLRPDTEWAAGRPTFDIKLLSELAVYPGYLRNRRGVNLDTMLTADQYASLVKVLPVESDRSQECRKGLERIEAWARMHKLSSTFPANEVIREMRWYCGVGPQ